ncbi:amino acid permease [Lactobacillus sp. S2-2]|uniref:amino acid permease n=1 Tax=Lactobacillus sp. S2-2 TaxID=2692917 RepID=UPI00351CD25F
MSENTNNNKMARNLKGRHVQLIALGGTIGTGLFLGAGQSIHSAGPSIVLAYLIAGLACFLFMRALGELLLSDIDSPSFITFITKYLGDKVGFVAGWTYWFTWISIAMAEITATGIYMKFWFPDLPQWVTGLVVLLLIYLLNSISVAAFGETEFWFSIIKIVAIIALIVTGLVLIAIHYKTPVGHATFANLASGHFFNHQITGFLLSFQMVIFSFAGIEMVGMTASETQNPEKVLPKAINDIPVRIILFYLGSLVILMSIFPWENISPNTSPFVQVFQSIGITSAATIINFVVLTAAASACNSAIYTTGRMLYTLTSDSKTTFGKKLNTLSDRHVPRNSVLLSSIVVAIAVILNIVIPDGVFELISSVATTCLLFTWSLISLAHYKYRKSLTKEETSKLTFKMPFFPYTNFFVVGFMVFVALVMLMKRETAFALIGAIIWISVLFIFKINIDKKNKIK